MIKCYAITKSSYVHNLPKKTIIAVYEDFNEAEKEKNKLKEKFPHDTIEIVDTQYFKKS